MRRFRMRRRFRRSFRRRGGFQRRWRFPGRWGPGALSRVSMAMPRVHELKYNDVGYSSPGGVFSVNASGTGSFALLNGITQGTDNTQRIGRLVHIRKIFFSGYIDSKLATLPMSVRLVVVYDRQTNGAAFNITDLYDTFGGNVTTSSMRNLDNRDRFLVLKDKRWSCNTLLPSPSNVAHTVFPVTIVMKKVMLPTLYNNVTGGIADIASGSIFALLLTDPFAGVVNTPLLNGLWRVRFVDA